MRVDRNVTYKKMKKFVLFETIVSLLFNGVIDVTYVYFKYNSSILMTLSLVFESLACMCNSLIVLQYVSLAMFLRHICNCINNDLEICYDMCEDFCTYSIIRSHPGRAGTFRLPRMKQDVSLRNKVHYLRVVYSRLSVVIRLLNSYYGLSILMIVSWLFTSIVSVLYSTIFIFTDSTYTETAFERYANASGSLSWCIYCGILMAMITTSCHLVGDETDNTMFHIQNLLLHHGTGNETEKELKIFCSQVKYLKLELTACGFFTLNLPLLKSFISVCFAYFVIMFQLK